MDGVRAPGRVEELRGWDPVGLGLLGPRLRLLRPLRPTATTEGQPKAPLEARHGRRSRGAMWYRGVVRGRGSSPSPSAGLAGGADGHRLGGSAADGAGPVGLESDRGFLGLEEDNLLLLCLQWVLLQRVDVHHGAVAMPAAGSGISRGTGDWPGRWGSLYCEGNVIKGGRDVQHQGVLPVCRLQGHLSGSGGKLLRGLGESAPLLGVQQPAGRALQGAFCATLQGLRHCPHPVKKPAEPQARYGRPLHRQGGGEVKLLVGGSQRLEATELSILKEGRVFLRPSLVLWRESSCQLREKLRSSTEEFCTGSDLCQVRILGGSVLRVCSEPLNTD
mmetsp:Transcript_19177/g.53476  ORF Transcript_19177/g.53476 Transcript_19177/m.53476 type:complete len:332 (+) Transcript_19177:1351-2346(+)